MLHITITLPLVHVVLLWYELVSMKLKGLIAHMHGPFKLGWWRVLACVS
jgi:hypothetical protein